MAQVSGVEKLNMLTYAQTLTRARAGVRLVRLVLSAGVALPKPLRASSQFHLAGSLRGVKRDEDDEKRRKHREAARRTERAPRETELPMAEQHASRS